MDIFFSERNLAFATRRNMLFFCKEIVTLNFLSDCVTSGGEINVEGH